MAATEQLDIRARDPESLARYFEFFGEVECPQLDAHLYRSLCAGVVRDAEILSMAAETPPNQPAANLLFGAVHYLLLGGEAHALREWYPALAVGEPRDPRSAYAPFRSFCLEHRTRIEALIRTRLTQTNVVQRCSVLLPAFAHVWQSGGGAPLALIEIGPSAGLNLQWDRYRYRYARAEPGGEARGWGDPQSPVLVECELRGDGRPSRWPEKIPIESRRGIDINPVDVTDPDAVQWLRALIWPDHVGRQERLGAAIEIARAHPPTIVRGNAAERLPDLISRAPADATLCVYGTHTLYQFPRDDLIYTLKSMQSAASDRPVYFASCEGTGDRCSELRLTTYRGSERETALLARCNPHGRWLEWLV